MPLEDQGPSLFRWHLKNFGEGHSFSHNHGSVKKWLDLWKVTTLFEIHPFFTEPWLWFWKGNWGPHHPQRIFEDFSSSPNGHQVSLVPIPMHRWPPEKEPMSWIMSTKGWVFFVGWKWTHGSWATSSSRYDVMWIWFGRVCFFCFGTLLDGKKTKKKHGEEIESHMHAKLKLKKQTKTLHEAVTNLTKKLQQSQN